MWSGWLWRGSAGGSASCLVEGKRRGGGGGGGWGLDEERLVGVCVEDLHVKARKGIGNNIVHARYVLCRNSQVVPGGCEK